MIDNDVLLFSATNEETPYGQLPHYWASRVQGFSPYKMPTLDRGITWTLKCQKWTTSIFYPKYHYIVKRKGNEN